MNKKYKALLAATMAAPLLLTTSCIEEVTPTSGAIQEQIDGNPKATEGLVWGMASNMNNVFTMGTINNFHGDFGNPALMHARDVMTEDMSVEYGGGYDWFSTWSRVSQGMDDLYIAPNFTWQFYYSQVLSCNTCIKGIPADTKNPTLLNYLATAYAFRASTYLDMARMFEFMPNNVTNATAGKGDITGLTAVIVTENTTEEASRNNPRVPHNEMVKFIKTDLTNAINAFKQSSPASMSKTLPNLAVAYGLMARLYLWDASYVDPRYNTAANTHAGESAGKANELYNKAAEYANLAIQTSGATPLTKDQWLDTTTGFNDISVSSWMWGQDLIAEDNAVRTGIVNWTSFMANEADFGYAGAGARVMVGASLYDRMSDRDFRKYSYVAPEGSKIAHEVRFIDDVYAEENFKPYYTVKFRPGNADCKNPKIGAAVGIPLMRVEEMHFIVAEAMEQVAPGTGIAYLNDFMKTYRYANYRQTQGDNIEEIILQKRIEFFGEGLTYFDVKRLNMSVIRHYDGSNFEYGANTYNTQGRPFWMNIVIPGFEYRNNTAIQGWNNPSVANKMQPVPPQN